MPDIAVEYQLRIRNAADSANELVVTSVRGGTNPYIAGPPSGDGASIDPYTGKVTSGSFSLRVVDPITSGSSRLFTSKLDDATGRPQLGQRKAFLEFREDGGAWKNLYAGRLARYALATAIEWDISVGDWMQAEHETTMHKASNGESIVDYIARWPNRGCLYGGPVRGGFLTMPNTPGWQVRVRDATFLGSHTRYRLEPVVVYGPDSNALNAGWIPGAKLNNFSGKINEAVRTLPRGVFNFGSFGALETVAQAQGNGMNWTGLVVLIGPDSAPVPFRPISPSMGNAGYGGLQSLDDIISPLKGNDGPFIYLDTQAPLVLGSTVLARCVTVLPTELCPIYWTGHPVDLLALWWTEAGFPYSAASLETVRDALGATLRVAIRVTGPLNLGATAEALIYGPLGVGARTNDDGDLEAFVSRIFVNTLPSVTITAADVDQDSVRAYDLDSDKAVRIVRLEHIKFTIFAADKVDGVQMSPEKFEDENADPGAIGTGEVNYTVPGMIRFADAANIDLARWVDGRAHEIFDRKGRGPIGAEMLLLRGGAGDDVKLGDEILVDLAQMPKANKRMGDDVSVSARAMQVVHITPELRGKAVTLEDSGPNAQPIDFEVELTIAASATAPRNVAEVTIDNEADITAAEYAVRLQVAITEGAADPEDFCDVAYFRVGQVPATAIPMPSVSADRTVSVRGRVEQNGSRPGDWSTPVTVDLDALDPPTSLVATPNVDDASQCELEWDLGDTETNLEIFLRESSQGADEAVLVDRLEPGSARYTLLGLTDDVEYVVTVNHYDPATGDRSTSAEETFTAGEALITLSPPTGPDAFSFGRVVDPVFAAQYNTSDRPGLYGMGVKATELEAEFEVYESVETAIASGLFSSFLSRGKVPVAPSGWTIWSAVAPNDGRRRRLQGRHVRDGMGPSAFTEYVTVAPWTFDPLATVPVLDGLQIRFIETTGADPDNFLYGEIQVIDSKPQGADTVTLIDQEPLSTAMLVDPTDPVTGGMSTGTPTDNWDTTGAVAIKLARPDAGDPVGVEHFIALADNRTAVELAINVQPKASTPVAITSVGVGVVDYGANTVSVGFGITGSYNHFHVILNSGLEQPAGQTIIDVGAQLGYDIDAGGANVRTITPTVIAHDASNNILASASGAPTDFNANDDF